MPAPVGVAVDVRWKMSLETSLVQVLLYGHSAFQGNWANLNSLPKGWETPTHLGSPSTGNALRNLPGQVVYGPLETKEVQNVL